MKMKSTIAAILCVALVCSGCASMSGALVTPSPRTPAPTQAADPSVMVSYVTHLAIGSRVAVDLTDGHSVKGTLMKADSGGIVVQPRTRIPEPPIQIPLDRISAVETETNVSTARTFGIGFGAGAAGGLAAIFLLAAIAFAGD